MNSLLEGLNNSQKEAVLHINNPLIIFAGAGTGKTRVITFRIAYLLNKGIFPNNILAVTFTNKAAEEMRQRLNDLAPGQGRNVWISTFHSFCAKFLRIEAKNIGLNQEFLIYDTSDQKNVLKECIKELNLDEKKFKPGNFVEIISRAKDNLLDAGSYGIHALTSTDYLKQTAASVYALYQKKLNKSGALDFGDLLMVTVLALKENSALREKYQEKFKYLLVDEYQDTNHAQYILTKYLSGKYKNICVVGDDDQSVYSWRGADIRNILEFEKDYPDCKTIKLEQNYRSTPIILNSAWQVIKNNSKRIEKKLWTEKPDGSPIQVFETLNEVEEAQKISEEIEYLTKKNAYPLKDFAVFYRTNAQSRVFEDAFRRAGIQYTVIGTVRFYERSEVKDIMAYLRLVHNPNDSVSFKRVINIPRRGIGNTSIEALEKFAQIHNISLWETLNNLPYINITKGAIKGLESFRKIILNLRGQLETKTVKEIALGILDSTLYIKELKEDNTSESQSRIENIYELISAIDEFERRSPDKTLSGYLTQVSLVNDTDKLTDEKDNVTLMTLHLAKGLEFKTVFLTGLEEGLFPIGEAAFDPSELEEERRLMYVGMTRAKEKLYLSWTAERRIFGKSKLNMPSRFIEEANLIGNFQTLKTHNDIKPRPSYYRNNTNFQNKSNNTLNFQQKTQEDIPVVDTDKSGFKLGGRVKHKSFGEGKIIDKSGTGDDLKLVVLFDNGQWKKLIVKYANLEKL